MDDALAAFMWDSRKETISVEVKYKLALNAEAASDFVVRGKH